MMLIFTLSITEIQLCKVNTEIHVSGTAVHCVDTMVFRNPKRQSISGRDLIVFAEVVDDCSLISNHLVTIYDY